MRGNLKQKYLFGVALLLFASAGVLTRADIVDAAQITDRTLTLQEGTAGDGGSKPGGTVDHKFDFDVPTTGTAIGSIKFEYCDTAQVSACSAPTGMDATGVSLGAQSGGATGFTIGNGTDAPAPTANVVYITRASASNPTQATLSYTLDDVQNPTTANYTFYVRISTYAASDGTGTAIDTGSVAASTANEIDFTGIMPETLVFCTGATVDVTCQTITNDTIDFGLFSPTATVSATSEMAASTNGESGYAVTVSGATLTSGSNTIDAIGGTATTSSIGTSQFGLNLVDNATPNVGTNVTPAFDGGDYLGQPSAQYDTADNFAFNASASQTVAASTGPSAAQEYTISYIVNVAGNQPPGVYTTTLTYICTPTY